MTSIVNTEKKKLEDSALGKTAFWLALIANIYMILVCIFNYRGLTDRSMLIYSAFMLPSIIMAIFDLNNKNTSNKWPKYALIFGPGVIILFVLVVTSINAIMFSFR